MTDLQGFILAVLGLLLGGGGGGLVGQALAERRQRKRADAEKAAAEPKDEVELTDLVRKLAKDAVADADDRVESATSDAKAARSDAAEARASAERAWGAADDSRALAELLARQLARATAHIKDELEPEVRRLGGIVPPWPPDPDPDDPVISHDRRSRDEGPPEGTPERRRR